MLPDNAASDVKKLSKKPTFRSYVNQNATIPPPSMTDLSFVDDYFGNSLNAIGLTMPSDTKEGDRGPTQLSARARPQPVRKAPDPPTMRKAPDPPPPRPPRGQKVPLPHTNLIDL